MSALEQLDDHLEHRHAPLRAQTRDEGWSIDSDDLADWAMRKLRRLKSEHDEISDAASRRIAEIEDWRDRQHARLEGDIDFFSSALEGYLRSKIDDDPDLRTLDLPSGKVKARKSSAKAAISNDDEATAWAEQHAPEAIKRRTLVSKLRDHVEVRRVIVRLGPDGGDELVAVQHEDHDEWLDAEDRSIPLPFDALASGQVVDTEEGEVLEDFTAAEAVVASTGDGWLPVPGCRVDPKRLSVSVKPKMDGGGS